jgi:hypothetical protein
LSDYAPVVLAIAVAAALILARTTRTSSPFACGSSLRKRPGGIATGTSGSGADARG